ncbi:MFS transporter [Nonomuraea wenchangensis]|uniref:Major Facilitator Superfamily protein n=1 Tax=Nonomuraea wenchangensis TaxID=568860 RepID=A0A1I0L5Q4_9ACTN|nr:MFS transporter [Nonomuraea wenchangensis]SEU34706.1 Major Facilitator Superfamily protein [Nonomuraea wenchangensis]
MLAFAVAVGTLQMTVVVPLLPGLEEKLQAPSTTVSWTLTAGLLSGAVSIPLLARLGDMYGRRTTSLVALGMLVAGSILSAVAGTLPLLIVGRVLQGTAAPLLPLAMGLVRQVVPGHRLPSAIGVLSATIGVGSGGGMILAGVLDGNHRAVFWALAGLAVLSFVLVAVVVREAPARGSGRPDLAGAVLVAVWLVCLLLAISKGATWGWISPLTLGLFVVAVAVAAVWVATARRTASPLIEIPMLLHRGTVGATVASFLLGFALFATITTVSAVAQGALGASVLQVGIYLLPTTVLMLVVSVLAGPLMRRFTASALVAGGSVLVTAATLWLAVSRSSGVDLYGAATLLGLGIGLGYAALGTMAVEHVEPAKTAAAGGVNALVRVVGSSVAGAVGAAVLSSGGAGWTFGVAAGAALLAALFSAFHGNLSRKELA